MGNDTDQTISKEAFEQLVLEAFERIPEKFRAKVDNVALTIEEDLSHEDRAREGLDESDTLLGLYVGIPASERGDHYGEGETLPDVIKIYRQPVIEVARKEGKTVSRVVDETVRHEIAHYFGMDELEARSREKP